jgi:23S rRNA (uracil1939-C5)-methyltransferase
MAQIFKPSKKSVQQNKHYSLDVIRMDHQGAGIGYVDKKPVFVEGTLPGETVVVQNIESKAKYAKAKLIKVVTSSESRIEPFCSKYHECGGCNLQHLSHEDQVRTKQDALQQLMKKYSAVTLPLSEPVLAEQQAYRRRARLALQLNKQDNTLKFGLRAKQSKQIVDIDHCPVMVDPINELLPSLRTLVSGFKKLRELGHIEIVAVDSGVHITLRTTAILDLTDKHKLVNYAAEKGCAIELRQGDNALELLAGTSPRYDESGLPLHFSTSDFIQINASVNHKMISQALEWLDLQPQHNVLDLFCGMGNFTLPIAKKVKQVTGIEGVSEMVEQAKSNAQINSLENVEFYQGDLSDSSLDTPWSRAQYDRILLDPARTGASGIVDKLSAFNAEKIVYVSCNPATLARDSQKLNESGYELQKIGMLDMFPHTGHLESMALFVKSKKAKRSKTSAKKKRATKLHLS